MYLVKPNETFFKLDPDGFFINDPGVGRWMFRDGISEGAYIDWCRENFIRPDRVFLDIGAHIGSWSWSLAQGAAHTWAFEPNPEVYNCLCANIFLKGLNHQITAMPWGLSSESGTATYRVRSSDGGGNGFTHLGEQREKNNLEERELPIRKLDDLGLENIGFIKLDVEGHEIEVLRGGVQTLEGSGWPPILFESWEPWREDREHRIPARELRSELWGWLEEHGYRIIPVGSQGSEIFLAEQSGTEKKFLSDVV
jgi:FkbM family methyltransferase